MPIDTTLRTIPVWPANEDVRRYMKHPLTNVGFGEDRTTSADWPDDAFTRRRFRDGDILDHAPERHELRAGNFDQAAPASGIARVELETWTREQLLTEAERVGATVKAKATKEEIVDAIVEKQ